MFKVLKARKRYKCQGFGGACNSNEISPGDLYIRYQSFMFFEGFHWINQRLCLDCGFDQMCHTDMHCSSFRLEGTEANFEELKKHEKFAHFLEDAKRVKPGVYIIGGVKIAGSTFYHSSIHNYLKREERKDE